MSIADEARAALTQRVEKFIRQHGQEPDLGWQGGYEEGYVAGASRKVEVPADEREALTRAVGAILFNVNNFPERAQRYLLGANMAPLNAKITDAVQAAGFRKVEAAPSDTEALIEEAERVYEGAVEHDEVDYEVGLIQRLGLVLSRTSQPVQVEVTDDMVERALNEYMKIHRSDDGQISLRESMRAALSAALGGGDHAG